MCAITGVSMLLPPGFQMSEPYPKMTRHGDERASSVTRAMDQQPCCASSSMPCQVHCIYIIRHNYYRARVSRMLSFTEPTPNACPNRAEVRLPVRWRGPPNN